MWGAAQGAQLEACRYLASGACGADFSPLNANGQGCLHKVRVTSLMTSLMTPPSNYPR